MRSRLLLVALLAAACGSPQQQWDRLWKREQEQRQDEQLAIEREIALLEEREQTREDEQGKAPATSNGASMTAERERAHEGEKKAVAEMHDAMDAVKARDFDLARTHAERAAELRPGFIDPLMLLAALDEHAGEFDRARGRYREVLAVDPTDSSAGVALGFTYLREKRFDEARDWFAKAIQADPGCEPAAFNLGSLAEQQRRFDEAASWFDVAAALDRRDPRGLERMAVIRLAQGRAEDALAAADGALARWPNSPTAQAVRARCLQVLGRH